jgi:hypothetical protein
MLERPNRAKKVTPARQTAEENENEKHKRRQKRRPTFRMLRLFVKSVST